LAAAAAEQGDVPSYEDGVLAGQELGRQETVQLVRLLHEKGDAYMRTRGGPQLIALDSALRLARLWLAGRTS